MEQQKKVVISVQYLRGDAALLSTPGSWRELREEEVAELRALKARHSAVQRRDDDAADGRHPTPSTTE